MNITHQLAAALRALRDHAKQTELYDAQRDADEALAEYAVQMRADGGDFRTSDEPRRVVDLPVAVTDPSAESAGLPFVDAFHASQGRPIISPMLVPPVGLANAKRLVGFQITERGSCDDGDEITPAPTGYALFTPNLTHSHRLTLFIRKENIPAMRRGAKYLVTDVTGQEFEVESWPCGEFCHCAAAITGIGPKPRTAMILCDRAPDTASEGTPDELPEPAMLWLTGWNIPGYLPDTSPYEHATFADACADLIEELARARDERADESAQCGGDTMCNLNAQVTMYDNAISQVERLAQDTARKETGFWVAVGKHVWWVARNEGL